MKTVEIDRLDELVLMATRDLRQHLKMGPVDSDGDDARLDEPVSIVIAVVRAEIKGDTAYCTPAAAVVSSREYEGEGSLYEAMRKTAVEYLKEREFEPSDVAIDSLPEAGSSKAIVDKVLANLG